MAPKPRLTLKQLEERVKVLEEQRSVAAPSSACEECTRKEALLQSATEAKADMKERLQTANRANRSIDAQLQALRQENQKLRQENAQLRQEVDGVADEIARTFQERLVIRIAPKLDQLYNAMKNAFLGNGSTSDEKMAASAITLMEQKALEQAQPLTAKQLRDLRARIHPDKAQAAAYKRLCTSAFQVAET